MTCLLINFLVRFIYTYICIDICLTYVISSTWSYTHEVCEFDPCKLGLDVKVLTFVFFHDSTVARLKIDLIANVVRIGNGTFENVTENFLGIREISFDNF